MKLFRLLPLLLLCLVPALRAEVSEAKLALARETIQAVQADRLFDSLGAQLKHMAMSQVRVPDSATAEDRQKIEGFLDKVTALTMSEAKALMAKMDVVYAEVYTEDELRAITTFFRSPEGRSMLAKQPALMAKVMPMAQEMQQKLLPRIQALVAEARAEETAAAEAPADGN